MTNEFLPAPRVLAPGRPSERVRLIIDTTLVMPAFTPEPRLRLNLILGFLILAALIAGGQIAILVKMRQREARLSAKIAAQETLRERENSALRESVDRLLRASEEQTGQIAQLAAASQEAAMIQPPAPALAKRPPAATVVATPSARPSEPAAVEGPLVADIPAITPSAAAGPGVEALAPATTVMAAIDNTDLDPPQPRRNRFLRMLSNPIVIDGAVLASSVLVPPSLPLTLAQSRLGRSLSRRVLRKTHTDKTVGGRVASDVLNMPITQKRKKK
jgi:hypothetical protein